MTVKSISSGGHLGFLQARDGARLRYGTWRAQDPRPTGTVVLLGGRTEFLEKYGEVIAELTARGLDVHGLDWRGQGLSDRLLTNPNKCFIRSYDQYLADLDLFLTRVVHPHGRGPVVVLAHSMGAHILLRYLDREPCNIARAVVTAPMIDIRTQPLPPAWVRWLSRHMVQAGRECWNIPAVHRHNPFLTPFTRNRLTSDAERFRRTQRYVAQHPELSAADVTYGWLAATFTSIDAINRRAFGKRIKVPVLMVLSGRDRVVSNAAARRLALRLPGLELTVIGDAQHEILQERDDLRARFWACFDDFIAP